MSMTVTATQGGSTANGMLLRVFVLTAAAWPQHGAYSQAGGVGETDLVTTFTGSRIYGANISNEGTLTPASGTTQVDDVLDTGAGGEYGTFKSTALTTSLGPVTVGDTNSSLNVAILEVAPINNLTLTEDASSPPVVDSLHTATTVTTASFTPPPSSVLVALVSSNGGAGTVTMTVNGGGLTTWQEVTSNAGTATGYAGVWIAYVPPAVLLLAGSEADTNLYGGSATDTNKYGGSITDSNLYGGLITDTNLYGGSGSPCTMQNVNITLGEYNDEVVNLAITNNGSAFNLTGYNLQVLLKVNQGDSDTASTTKLYSSTGGSPAITITNAAGGLATLKIPRADISNTSFTFWRCDVLDASSDQNTALYGAVTMTKL